MNFEMTHGLRPGWNQELREMQRLRIESRLINKISLQIELLMALRGELYRPNGQCPKCGHKLSTVEILKGFRRDPNDFTTGCPRCNFRFNASLACWYGSGSVEVPFYCKQQTLAQLPRRTLTPEQFLKELPGVYRSAMFHFGGLKNAYRQVGGDYPYAEMVDGWMVKVVDFVGRVPDEMIASVAGVTVSKVRKLRRDLKLPAFHGYRDRVDTYADTIEVRDLDSAALPGTTVNSGKKTLTQKT